MSFADWKKRSTFASIVDCFLDADQKAIEALCRAAYKSGERAGLKRGEELAKMAMTFRKKLGE